MVSATPFELTDLISPIAKRLSRVMFSGPWPVRIRQRSSSNILDTRKWERNANINLALI